MLWYEPYGSPADWALKHSSDIDALCKNWNNCKFNPSVLKAYMCDDEFNFNKFGCIMELYEESQATPSQYKDLFFIGFEKLKDFVNANIDWKFSKLSEDKKKIINMDPEVVSILLQISFIFNGDPTQIFINNYPDVNDYLKNVVTNVIIDLYKRECCMHDSECDCYVEKEYAANTIKEIITNINKTTLNNDLIYDFEGSPFVYFVCRLLKNPCQYEAMIRDIIIEIGDEYCKRCNHSIVANVTPYTPDHIIDDIYDSIFHTSNKDEASQMLIALLSKAGCCKDEACKVSKLCINNINHYYDNCISKSCEESIINGIKDFTDFDFGEGAYDLDECITALEAITYDIVSATEANRQEEDYDYDFDPEPEEDPDDIESTPKREDPTKAHTNDKKNITKRDFDADYRKFKKNARNVDVSLTKILSTVKGFLTGTSETRGIRKATGMDSVAQILARVFGTIAVFHVSKFLGLLFVVVRLANSRKVTERERAKIVTELKNEIETIDASLSDGSIENSEARRDLTRTKQNLQEALDKISAHRGRNMTEGAKQAVRDVVDKR